ncbi:MAG: hypothetical protein LBC49_02965 [Bacteroidales bacterium]|jgi:hypothetical protein|nr:hypothetical protein [Bacteroidales bacterium]
MIYKSKKGNSTEVCEPSAAYSTTRQYNRIILNPNEPFNGTQSQWWEHISNIEQGSFTPLQEANQEFEEWKKQYLAKTSN